jgi:glutamate carboxypeptidase
MTQNTGAVPEQEMLALLERLVSFESPSGEKAVLDRLADELATVFSRVGRIERLANPDGGDHLRITVDVAGSSDAPVLLVGHYDTVWPVGTLAERPFRIDGDAVHGPGAYDMKAGLVMIFTALGGFGVGGATLRRPVQVFINSDEEIGSPTSRALIEETARGAAHVLVLEPPIEPYGVLKTARKGGGDYRVTIHGRAAHAGVEPEKGRSAIVEMAHQILAIQRIADAEKGTTLNVGVVSGGSRPNVVAAQADLHIDVRVWTMAEAERVEAAMRALSPVTPDVTLTVSGGLERPPMERTPASRVLYARAQEIGAAVDIALDEGGTGGGSDGNFTAALGVPTLDGLGSPGVGAHALHEQISRAGLRERTRLLAALLSEL